MCDDGRSRMSRSEAVTLVWMSKVNTWTHSVVCVRCMTTGARCSWWRSWWKEASCWTKSCDRSFSRSEKPALSSTPSPGLWSTCTSRGYVSPVPPENVHWTHAYIQGKRRHFPPNLSACWSTMMLLSVEAKSVVYSVLKECGSQTSWCFCASTLVMLFRTRYLKSALMEILQGWHKRSLGLRDELIRFWCSEVKGHCDLEEIFSRNSRIRTLIMTEFDPNCAECTESADIEHQVVVVAP